jgi:hypothetical protein
MAKADRRADRWLDDIEPLELGAVAQQCFAILVQHLQGNIDLDFVAQNAQRLGALLGARGKTVEAGVDHRLHACGTRLMLSSIDSTICLSTNGTPSALSRTL